MLTPAGTPPRIDVVVPCYGYAHLLEDCVRSVLDQENVDVRVLVIDDASPDRTASVADSIARRDSRVTLVSHETNRGHLATFDHGLELVEAEYTCLVSADDLLHPGALARATRVLGSDPALGFVYGRATHFADRLPPTRPRWTATIRHEGPRWIRARCERGVNVISSPEVVVRTSVHRQVGGYEASLPHTADLHLWLRLATVADVAFLAGRPLAGYRVHAGSLQRTVHSGIELDLRERLEMFRHLATHAWRDRGDLLGLVPRAERAIASEAFERAARALELHRLDEADRLADLGFSACGDPSGLGAYEHYRRRRVRRASAASQWSRGARRRIRRTRARLEHRYLGS